MQHDWGKLFKEADGDGSGRLTFLELEALLRDRLSLGGAKAKGAQAELVSGVTREDLLALWATVDVDRSGEVTGAEWSRCLYRLELASWPTDEAAAQKCVAEMNKAAAKWHQAGGNWYKVFRLIDSDNSGNMGFDELREIVRRPLPCLAISAKKVSDQDLRAMWKALDEDRSGQTTVREFMVFMRRHGAKRGMNLHRSPTQERLRSRAESRTQVTRLLSGPEVALLNAALEKLTPDSFEKAYMRWNLPWTGNVSEWDLLSIVRDLMALSEEQLDDDCVHAFWRYLDKDSSGEVPVETLFSIMGELREQASGEG
jgi:Ca2+-binding EF-hand superfamily protein